MALYTYTAKTSQGETKTGKLEAGSEAELAALLRKQELYLVEATSPEQPKHKKGFLKQEVSFDTLLFWRGIPLSEKMLFVRNLAVTIKAGLSLTRSIDVLGEQTTSSKLRKILNDINANISKGKGFADSLESYPKEFDELFINMIRAGEASGTLETTLVVLYKQLKKEYTLRKKVRGALIYPGVIVSAMVLIGALMMIYVVPTLAQTFSELEVELPPTTQFVIWFSTNLSVIWPFLLGGIVAFVVLIRLVIKRTTWGRHGADKLLLIMPLISPLVKKINAARFARTLSSLIESGMPILKALDITSHTVGNVYYAQTIIRAQEEVQKGGSLSSILNTYPNLYPPMVIQMIAVGEETGALASLLKRVALFFESDVAEATKNLSTIIEPVLMVVIGAAVGFFAVSMIQPMYSLVGSI